MTRATELYAGLESQLVMDHNGGTVYNKCDIELSPGCQSCKRGDWHCSFPGHACNATCSFCSFSHEPRPWEKPDYYMQRPISEYVESVLNQNPPLKGVSFSGGECLLYKDKLAYIATAITNAMPEIYKWCYTNALLLDDETIEFLKQCGINEIRVNAAATNFADSTFDKIKKSAKIMDRVTIEIPSIPQTYEKLINEKKIEKAIDCGVTQINLSEYFFIRKRNTVVDEADVLPGEGGLLTTKISRELTRNVIKYVIDNSLPIVINDCSMDAKTHQCSVRKNRNI